MSFYKYTEMRLQKSILFPVSGFQSCEKQNYILYNIRFCSAYSFIFNNIKLTFLQLFFPDPIERSFLIKVGYFFQKWPLSFCLLLSYPLQNHQKCTNKSSYNIVLHIFALKPQIAYFVFPCKNYIVLQSLSIKKSGEKYIPNHEGKKLVG